MSDTKFDDATKKELGQFLESQQAQARVQSSIHNFTTMCWEKCVPGTPGTKFSKGEESCLTNCVGRFLDTSIYFVNKIQQQREDNILNNQEHS